MNDHDGKPIYGAPLKFGSVELLQKRIDEYFESCYDYLRDQFGNRVKDKDNPVSTKEEPVFIMKQVKPFTVTGLAVHLDTTRDVLMDYESGKYDDSEKAEELNAKFSNTIKRAKQRIYAYAEEQLFMGKQATGPIFNLKNNWNWKDQRDITTGGRPIIPVPLYDMSEGDGSNDGTAGTDTGDQAEAGTSSSGSQKP